MKSIEIAREGYSGIPADKEALVSYDDLALWAGTKDAELIPQAIATIKGLKALVDTTAVTADETTLTVKVDGKEEAHVGVTPAWSGSDIVWASTDSAVATVEQDVDNPALAVVTGVAAGTVNVTATANGNVDTIAVTVEA